jgi:hypothetical protein
MARSRRRVLLRGFWIVTIVCGAWSIAAPRAVAQADNARRPANEQEMRKWLEIMVWRHGFSPAEIGAATGMSDVDVAAALLRFAAESAGPPPRQAGAPLLVVPYPGGRHPRIGFLEGAERPQRETKFSVFAPWDPRSYVVVDVPEAIFSNLGITYLAHRHIPTIWTDQGVELQPLEWQGRDDGGLQIERRLPNGITFGVQASPRERHVEMELWIRNDSNAPLTGLRAQNCVLFKGAAGFTDQTNGNKVFAPPYAACRDPSGERWVITGWTPCQRAWGNEQCPCIHADPQFPDCPVGETVRARGILAFFEGTDLKAELERLNTLGWQTVPTKE